MPSILNHGTFTNFPYFASELAKFNLSVDNLVKLMYNTSMVLSGGFAVNQLLHMTGRDVVTARDSDIDFFVYGGVRPRLSDYDDMEMYESQVHKERAFRGLVVSQFRTFVRSQGYYEVILEDEEYVIEPSEQGDCIFTSGSNARLNVLTYTSYNQGVMKKLNLVFSDTPIPEIMRKVDISLTAGFIYALSDIPEFLMYTHYFPEHMNQLELHWVQEDSTHTPRQMARWQKYKERYHILDNRTMTTEEFIDEFDELPDEIHITLVGTSEQLAARPVTRRMSAMPGSRFNMQIIPPLRIPIIENAWDEPLRDPGAPRHIIFQGDEEDEEDDHETRTSPSLHSYMGEDAISVISNSGSECVYEEEW